MRATKRFLGALAAVVLLGLAVPQPAAAQTREDTAAVLLEAARQLRAEGNGAAADALLQLLRRRYAGTAAAVDAGQLLAQLRSAPEPVRSGRVELLVFGTTYGLWAGLAVPIILDADSPEAYGAGLLLGGPAGFLATRAYLRQRPLTEGQARAISFGGTWGSWQGFGWTMLLADDQECYTIDGVEHCYDGDPDTDQLLAGTLGGGVAGIITGAILARKPISSGVATTVSFGGMWGAGFGAAFAGLADLEGDDVFASSLIGGNAGLVAMAVLAPRWDPSRSRARLVSLGGVVGLLGGLGLDLLVQPGDEKVAIAIPTATSAVGLLLASRATRHLDQREPPGGGGEGGASPFGGALLRYDGGQLGLDVPAVRLEVARERGRERTTSLYVPVFQARF